MKLQKTANTVYKTTYHIIWITQYRKIFSNYASYLTIKLWKTRKYCPNWEYLEIAIKRDHKYLYVHSSEVCAKSSSRIIKKNTSKSLNRKFAILKKVYWDRQGIWGKGYFVSTVGLNKKIILRYVKLQEKEEIGQAKLKL